MGLGGESIRAAASYSCRQTMDHPDKHVFLTLAFSLKPRRVFKHYRASNVSALSCFKVRFQEETQFRSVWYILDWETMIWLMISLYEGKVATVA